MTAATKTIEMKRVVITGVGVVSPIGIGKGPFLESLLAGRSGVRLIERFDTTDYPVKIAAEMRDFDAQDYIDKKMVRRMDRFAQYGAAASTMALDDSGYPVEEDPYAVGALIASGVGGLDTFLDQIGVLLSKGPDRVSPFFIPMIIANMAAATSSILLGLKGPVSTTCTACAAATNALGDAFSIIRRGDATAMFAGGAEAAVNEVGMSAFAALRALSARNDEPEKASRPFDAGRDGFVMGEGSGVLGAGGAGARRQARCPHLRGDRGLRHDRRRLPSDRAGRDRGARRSGHDPGPARCRCGLPAKWTTSTRTAPLLLWATPWRPRPSSWRWAHMPRRS